MPAPIKLGRASTGASISSSSPETPVNTWKVFIAAVLPPTISVSSLSPTANGFFDPTFFAARKNIAGSGLPAETGSTPVAFWTAATREPLPTPSPRSIGRDVSKFDAKYFAPARIARAPSVNCSQPTDLSKPCRTAAGLSSALETTEKPMSLAKSRKESAPIISTLAPEGISSAANCNTAWAEVTMSPESAVKPISVSIVATASGLRDALFVTYTAGTPHVLITSTTLLSGRPPSQTVPSKSNNKASCLLKTLIIYIPPIGQRHRSNHPHQWRWCARTTLGLRPCALRQAVHLHRHMTTYKRLLHDRCGQVVPAG